MRLRTLALVLLECCYRVVTVLLPCCYTVVGVQEAQVRLSNRPNLDEALSRHPLPPVLACHELEPLGVVQVHELSVPAGVE